MSSTKSITLFALVLLPWFPRGAFGQKLEIGIAAGGSNYHGDLARKVLLKESHFAGGIFVRYNFNPYFTWRPGFTYGKITGSDENFAENRLRNLNFRSNLFELSNLLEFNYKPFGSEVLTQNFTSFVFAGISFFRHNPQAHFRGKWRDLQPQHTEGQNDKQIYSLLQASIPFGGGVKYNLSKNWVLGGEIGWRKTFTDYLDDVSRTYPDQKEQKNAHGLLSAQLSDRSPEIEGVSEPLSYKGKMRGDPNLKDFYLFGLVTISYRFTPVKCWPGKKGNN